MPQGHIKLNQNREFDVFLMEAFKEVEFNKGKLLKINRFRLYLKAITLSDITDSLGERICNIAYNGKINPQRV